MCWLKECVQGEDGVTEALKQVVFSFLFLCSRSWREERRRVGGEWGWKLASTCDITSNLRPTSSAAPPPHWRLPHLLPLSSTGRHTVLRSWLDFTNRPPAPFPPQLRPAVDLLLKVSQRWSSHVLLLLWAVWSRKRRFSLERKWISSLDWWLKWFHPTGCNSMTEHLVWLIGLLEKKKERDFFFFF